MILNYINVLSPCRCLHSIAWRAKPLRVHSSLLVPFKRYASRGAGARTPFMQAIKEGYGQRTAIVDSNGCHSYTDILAWGKTLSRHILANATRDEKLKQRGSSVILNGERVAFLCPNNVSYAVTQWGVWMSGGTCVPLCKSHPESELEYVIEDSQSSLVIATKDLASKILPIVERHGINYLLIEDEAFHKQDVDSNIACINEEVHSDVEEHYKASALEDKISVTRLSEARTDTDDLIDLGTLTQKWSQIRWKNRNAILFYTSGTTGRPKGVVWTFGSLQTQIQMMVSAWGWSASDVILHVLPLHHVHGVVNVLACPLWCGAACVMLPSFDAETVWKLLLEDGVPRVNVFMAVPTVYAKLVDFCDQKYTTPKVQAFIEATMKEKIRLMVSGSAALPQPVLGRWQEISGHILLERYGMTELGMALTNSLKGERIPGAVGTPFPTVEVRIVSQIDEVLARGNQFFCEATPGHEGEAGELQVRGPSVFKEYWNKPDATREAFTQDDWFKTGDTASFEDGVFTILGRSSVDIIKSGGYKISALDIERKLLSHPKISEVVVVGLPDVTWGQRVAAAIVLKPACALTLGQLRDWARDHLPSYQIPTELKTLEEMPRNVMGKVNKKQLMMDIFGVE